MLLRFMQDSQVPVGHNVDTQTQKDAFRGWFDGQGFKKGSAAAKYWKPKITQAAKNYTREFLDNGTIWI